MDTLITSSDTPARPATPIASVPAAPATARWERWALAGAVIALAALATWNSARKSLWIDEAYSEYTSRLPVLGAMRRGLHYELQAPLYFGLLALWRDINNSVMFGRALSTLAAMAFVVVMAGIGRRAGLTRWRWLGIASAFVPGVVWAASELRGYALALLLTALTLYFFLGIVRSTSRVAPRNLIGYAGSAIALLFTFYYGGFALAGQWVAAVIAKRRPSLVTGMLAIAGCAVAPLVLIIRSQVALHPIDNSAVPSTNLRFALYKTGDVMIGAFEGRAEILSWPHVVPMFLAIALVFPLLRTLAPRTPWDRDEAALTASAIVPLAVLGMLRFFRVTPVHPQHLLVAMPGLLLIYAMWIDRTTIGWARFVERAVVAGITAVCLLSYQRYGVQREDWRSAARYVAERATPGDIVVVYDPDRVLPFNDYFQPIDATTPVYGVPVDINLETYDPMSYVIRDTTVVAGRLASLNAMRHPVWFVTAAQVLESLKDGPTLVLAYLGAHDHLDAPVSFVGVQVVRALPAAPHE